MFSCARVKDNLIIQINFKRAVIGLAGSLAGIALLLWIGWIIIVKIEAERLRKEIYQSISGAVATSIQDAFARNHSTLLKLEACQSQLVQSHAISQDLAKMMNKKITETGEEVTPPKKKKGMR